MSLRRSGAALNLQTLAASSCPSSITGKTYLGLYHDGADLLLWNYADGIYVSDEASRTTAYIPVYQSVCKIPSATKISYIGSFGGDLYVCCWDYVGNTFDKWNTAGGAVLGVAATSSNVYAMVGGQLYRLGLDCSSATAIGDSFSGQSLWVASGSALYSQRDDGGQKFGNHNGATPADPWTLTARDLISDGGDYDNFRVGSATTGLDTLVRYHNIGAGAGGSVTTLSTVSGAETALWPSHWISSGVGANRAMLGVGNDDVTVYAEPNFARLSLTDYSGVEVSCAWPSIEVEQHPVALAVPGAFIPLD